MDMQATHTPPPEGRRRHNVHPLTGIKALISAGEYDKAAIAASQALQTHPDDPKLMLLCARIALFLDGFDEAATMLAVAKQRGAPKRSSALLEARLEMARQAFGAARDALNVALAHDPRPLPKWAIRIVRGCIKNGDIEDLGPLLCSLENAGATRNQALLLSIELEALNGQFETALERMNPLLRECLKNTNSADDPNLEKAVQLAARLTKFLGADDALIKILREISQRWPDFRLPQPFPFLVQQHGSKTDKPDDGSRSRVDIFEQARWCAANGRLDDAFDLIDPKKEWTENPIIAENLGEAIARGAFSAAPQRPLLADDPDCDVLVSDPGKGNCTVIVFCGLTHRPMLPIGLLERLFSGFGIGAVYVRDFHNLLGGKGIRSLGDLDASVSALRGIVDRPEGGELVSIGSSGAGFVAIQYGLRLGAKRILNLAGPTCITSEFFASVGDKRARILQNRLQREIAASYLDTRPHLEKAGNRTVLHQFFAGSDKLVDGDYCRYLEDLPNVQNHEMVDFQHHQVAGRLLRDDLFMPCILGDLDD
ncbi:MAG: tetratricopeptide repeat protein [Paracoccaceae bacterium]